MKSYLPFDMTSFTFLILLQSTRAVLDEKRYMEKAKKLPVVYFQKIYIVSFGFLPYYKCISVYFKKILILCS